MATVLRQAPGGVMEVREVTQCTWEVYVNQSIAFKADSNQQPSIDELINRVQNGRWTRLQFLRELTPDCLGVMRAARDPRCDDSRKAFVGFINRLTPNHTSATGIEQRRQAIKRMAWLEQL